MTDPTRQTPDTLSDAKNWLRARTTLVLPNWTLVASGVAALVLILLALD
ncbi:MAG: hypothetical protein WBA25_02120 [Jannaschia sp.]